MKLETSSNLLPSSLVFYQFLDPESCTFTYLLGDSTTAEAVLIDPVLENIERDLGWVKQLELNLKYVFDTHVHADHITAAGEIRSRDRRKTSRVQTGVAKSSGVDCADLNLEDGDEFYFGSQKISVLSTPGHTESCLSFVVGDRVFTGDCLMIRGTGRTDFQGGSSEKLFESVREKLFKLPDETLVYPAHDYQGQTHSTISLEKKFNPRVGLKILFTEFEKIMNGLQLPPPKKIKESLPANLACGEKIRRSE